jgi:diguanylate cyclase (GGDEF)-like protein/PAS domain S-box-containing protein
MSGRLGRTEQIAIGYTAWSAILAAAYFVLPGAHLVTWTLIGLTCVGGIVTGLVLYRPSRLLPWILLGAANLAYTAGDSTFNTLTTVFGERDPYPSLADAFYLATYPLFAAGLVVFIRYRTGRDRDGMLDALIVTAGLAVLSWIYLIVPMAAASDHGFARVVSIAYPLGDVLMLAMLARLVLSAAGIRNVSLLLLTVGTAGILVSDVLYGLLQLHDRWHVGGPVDLGWVVFYWAWGLAALHPSMRQLTERVYRVRRDMPMHRLLLIGAASLIPPAMLLHETLHGRAVDGTVIAVFSLLLFMLVIARLAGVAATHRQALVRERVLRGSAAMLVAAANQRQIVVAARHAVGSLLVPAGPHRVVLAVAEGELLVEATDADRGPGWALARDGGGSATLRRALLNRRCARVPVAGLPEPMAAGLPGLTTALVFPLAAHHPSTEPPIGVLVVAAADRALSGVKAALETLASQVALAVERVALAHEVDLRNSEAYFRTLVHNAFDVILILDDDDTVRYASPSAGAMFDGRWLIGEPFGEFVVPADRDRVVASLARMRDRYGAGGHDEWRLQRGVGEPVHVEVRCSNLRREPTVRGLVLTLRDVTAQRELERELKHRAFHDALTGLPNRLLLLDRMEHALARSTRTGLTTNLLLIDLDDFKVINDTMGHPVGDELLVAVAGRLSAAVRAADTPARLGGDEFAVLVEDVASVEDVEHLAEHLTRSLTAPFSLSTGTIAISASVGIATSAESPAADELLRHADLALYAAKAAGRRQWCRFQPRLHAGMMERHALRISLDEAIAGSEFRLHYQPIVDLASGRVAGLEALARWPTSRHGVILPERFISLAEETGHIVQLGAWVLERAAADLVEWRRDLAPSDRLHVSVNVSARQLHDPGFVDSVRGVLASSGLPPRALLLELTESILMGRNDRVQDDLRALKNLGVRLAIDDFGTGYSSLSYLRDLPIDVIKIDKSFVDGISRSGQELALLEGIVRITDTLGLSTIAEGIESTAQRDLLARIGCQFGQGFLFSKPLPADEAGRLLRSGAPTPGGTGT